MPKLSSKNRQDDQAGSLERLIDRMGCAAAGCTVHTAQVKALQMAKIDYDKTDKTEEGYGETVETVFQRFWWNDSD